MLYCGAAGSDFRCGRDCFSGGECLTGFIRPVSHILLKCGKAVSISARRCSVALSFSCTCSRQRSPLHARHSDGRHRWPVWAKNGFHLFGQGCEHGFRQVSNSSSTGVATEIRFSGLNLKGSGGCVLPCGRIPGIPCRGFRVIGDGQTHQITFAGVGKVR